METELIPEEGHIHSYLGLRLRYPFEEHNSTHTAPIVIDG